MNINYAELYYNEPDTDKSTLLGIAFEYTHGDNRTKKFVRMFSTHELFSNYTHDEKFKQDAIITGIIERIKYSSYSLQEIANEYKNAYTFSQVKPYNLIGNINYEKLKKLERNITKFINEIKTYDNNPHYKMIAYEYDNQYNRFIIYHNLMDDIMDNLEFEIFWDNCMRMYLKEYCSYDMMIIDDKRKVLELLNK